jgi:folate-dependent tRNA-U54 methylase TrmFO/GidA
VFVAGQLSGVEGYVECIATGLLAGLALAGRVAESEDVAASVSERLTLTETLAAPHSRSDAEPEVAANAFPDGGINVALSNKPSADPNAQPNAIRRYAPPPRTTALGSLVHYITHASATNYQPANISFDLLPPMPDLPRAIARDRRARREKQCERALADFGNWFTGLAAVRAVESRE